MVLEPSSFGLIDKLHKLYDEGKNEELITELRHYLTHLDHSPKNPLSPLMLTLLKLFKQVLLTDDKQLDENLKIITKLFTIPGPPDLKLELLDMISDLLLHGKYKDKLFEEYFPYVESTIAGWEKSVKIRVINIFVIHYHDHPNYQEKILHFLVDLLKDLTSDLNALLLAGINKILEENPYFEMMMGEKIDFLMDSFIFSRSRKYEKEVLEIILYLPSFHEKILGIIDGWLQSPDYNLKRKALKLLPIIKEENLNLHSINLLLDNLADEDLEYQSSVVESLAKIMARNLFLHITRILNRYRCEVEINETISQGLIELFTILARSDFHLVFSKIFRCMDDLGENKDDICLNILQNLNFEYPKQFETQFFKILDRSTSCVRKEKAEILDKAEIIVSTLNSNLMYKWFILFLERLVSQEKVYDDFIANKCAILKEKMLSVGYGMQDQVDELRNKISYVEHTISLMKNYPRILRERTDDILRNKDNDYNFKLLFAEYESVFEKIYDFDKFLNKLEFKHLILDLTNEWYHAKEYIIEDLSAVKKYIDDSVAEKLNERKVSLLELISQFNTKKEVIKAELTELNSRREHASNLSAQELTEVVKRVNSIGLNIFVSELKFSEVMYANIDHYQKFKLAFKEWRSLKEDFSRILSFFNEKLDVALIDSKDENTNNQLLLDNIFTRFLNNTIQQYRTILKEVQQDTRAYSREIVAKDIKELEKSLQFKRSKLLDFIDQKTENVNQYFRRLQNSDDIETIMTLGRLKDEWTIAHDNLLNKVENFFQEKLEMLDAEKIKRMMNIINPIPLEALKKQVSSFRKKSGIKFIEHVLNLIHKYNIQGQIQERNLVNIENNLLETPALESLKIRPNFLIDHEKIALKLIIENQTVNDVYDLSVSIKFPPYLRRNQMDDAYFQRSFPLLESGQNKELSWEFDRNDLHEDNLKQFSNRVSRISVLLLGKLIGDKHFSKVEDINLILLL